MRVAAVQLTTTLDLAENRRRVAERIAVAADEGAGLVVFPEATMCTFGDDSFDLSSVAETLDGPFVEMLRGAAGRYGTAIVAGMFERSEEPGRAYNTAVVVGPDGLVAAYRKIHLFDALGARESDRVVPGDAKAGLVTFEIHDMVAGVMTCYDLRFPEVARALVDQGATLLVLPAHWYNGPGKAQVWETLVRARAIEDTAYVVAAGKPEPECVGLSMIVEPAGEVITIAGGVDECLVLADVTAQRVAEVRAVLPLLEHRRFRVEVG